MTDQTDPRLQPQARYILPSFIEHSSFGVKESNPYNKLFEERIIFLGVQVDDASANDIMAQLLVLESLDPDRDRWFTAQEALEYGCVDHVVSKAAMTDSTNPVTDN